MHSACDSRIVGTFEGKFVLPDSNLTGFCSPSPSTFLPVLLYTHTQNLPALHLSLADSFELYNMPVTDLCVSSRGTL